jgi:hypothetical protein
MTNMAAREAVRRGLTADIPAVTQALIEAVRAQIPAYRQLHEAQTAEITAIAGWALTRIVDLWATGSGGGLDPRDLARFRGIGAARARDGRPLTAVLRAYHVAAGEAIEEVARRGRGSLDIDDVLALSRLWLVSIDELSEALFSGYRSASEYLATDRNRALRELFDDLLTGRQTSAGALRGRLDQLGVSLPERPYLLVAEPGDAGRGLSEVDGDGLGGLLVTTRGRRLAVLLPSPGDPEGVAARGWRACLIARHPLTDLPLGYRLASDALDTAPAYAFDGRPVLDDGDARVLALLAARGNVEPEQVVEAVLGPLADPANQHLLAGLDAFLTTGSATAAAELLHVHPQTLRYRLRRVREITRRDPRLPWQRLVLDVARHLRNIRLPARS